jgi:hypothetical protein
MFKILLDVNLILSSIVVLVALRLWTGVDVVSNNKTISFIVRVASGAILLMNLFEIIKIISSTS